MRVFRKNSFNCGKMKVGLQACISCRAEGSEQGENPPEKGKGVLLEERPAESYNGSSTTKDQQWQQVKPKRRNRKGTFKANGGQGTTIFSQSKNQ